MLLGLQSFASGTKMNLEVKMSTKSLHVMNFTCSEENPFAGYARFRKMQIARWSGTGHETVWVTLTSTSLLPSPDFLDTMGNRSYHATGSVSNSSVRLEILIFEPELDLHMRSYGTFNCSVWYYYQPERRIGPTIEVIPGVGLPTQNAGFGVVLVVNHTVDLTCWATIPTQEFTLNMLRMSDNTVVASWNRSEILVCPAAPIAVCSDLQYNEVKGVVYARVRLMGVSNRDAGYQCYMEIGQEKHPSRVISKTPNQMDYSHGYSYKTLIGVGIITFVCTVALFVVVMISLVGLKNFKTLIEQVAEMIKPGNAHSQTPKDDQQTGSLLKGKK